MGRHTIEELYQWQALPLGVKVRMTKARIRDWVESWGEDGVYISFSGGKDSTVLLYMAREEYPNLKAVFVDTGLEYPEIREFVKKFDNVDWLKPKMNFKQVIKEYGYPFISKEISNVIHSARHSKDGKWKSTRMQRIHGELKAPDGTKSRYNCERYAFLLDAPFDVHDRCCSVMKKIPTKNYEKKTGKKPMLGQMAEESQKRTQGWLKAGCNAFDARRPQSNPMAFWTEQDVLLYIKLNNIEIASVYGDVVQDYEAMGQLEGQMSLSDLSSEWGLFELERPVLKTTGCKRTGCMFCGYGCHLEKAGEGRFELMKKTHPKQYDYIMRPKEQGGLDYKNVIDWINEHGNLNIKY